MAAKALLFGVLSRMNGKTAKKDKWVDIEAADNELRH